MLSSGKFSGPLQAAKSVLFANFKKYSLFHFIPTLRSQGDGEIPGSWNGLMTLG